MAPPPRMRESDDAVAAQHIAAALRQSDLWIDVVAGSASTSSVSTGSVSTGKEHVGAAL